MERVAQVSVSLNKDRIMKYNWSLLFSLMIFASTVSFAQPGSLDANFGADGIVTTSIGNLRDQCRGFTIQDDGKIVAVGYSDNGTNRDFALIRYNTNGTLDNTFSTDGRVTLDLGGKEEGKSVVVQADGKILIGGHSDSNSDVDFVIVRYNSDGTIDSSFGTSGQVSTDFGKGDDVATNILLVANGKILVTGYAFNGDARDFAAAQYNADGSLDLSFSYDGMVTTYVGRSGTCNSSVRQPDEKLILFGWSSEGNNLSFVALRYNADGTLDDTFGVNGIVVTDIGGISDYGYSLALQPDGKIVAVGYTYTSADVYNYAVVRYHADGSLDNSFGEDGIATASIGPDFDNITYVVIQPDGKIIVVGAAYFETEYDIAMIRFNTDGSIDHTFGSDGIVSTDIETNSNSPSGVRLQQDSKIVVSGTVFPGSTGVTADFTLTRYISGLNVGVIDFTIQDHNLLIYPNPLQDEAVIKYTLANDEIINIDLYDVSGRLVQSIVNSEERIKGSHKESLNLDTSVPSGSYILTISNGQGSSSIRVIK